MGYKKRSKILIETIKRVYDNVLKKNGFNNNSLGQIC